MSSSAPPPAIQSPMTPTISRSSRIRFQLAEYEAQLRALKEELDGIIYEQKNADLEARLKRLQSSSESNGKELASMATRSNIMLSSQISFPENERNLLLSKIKHLEKKIDVDRARFAGLLNDRDNEIDRLVSENAALLSDSNLMDNEIATYRKLLEGEEKRLSLSPKEGCEETPNGGTRDTKGRVLKRKREVLDEELLEKEEYPERNEGRCVIA